MRWLLAALLLASCAAPEPLTVPPIPPPLTYRPPSLNGSHAAARDANAARHEAARDAAREDATAEDIRDGTVRIMRMQAAQRRMTRNPTKANVAVVRRDTKELRERHRAVTP